MKTIETLAGVAMLAGLWFFIGGQSVWWGLAGFIGGLIAVAIATLAGDCGDSDGFAQQRADDDGMPPEDLGRWPFTDNED